MAIGKRALAVLSAVVVGAATFARADDDAGLPPSTVPGAASPAAAPTVRLGDDADLAGTFRVTGLHDKRGPFSGTLGLTRAGGALRYERRVRHAPGPVEVETGVATLDRGALELRAEGASTTGIDAIVTRGAPSIRRHARYTRTGLVWEGKFEETSGQGTERLDPRQGQDSLELLVDGREFFPALRRELRAARRSISIQTYSYVADETGNGVADILVERARAGVEVRLLLDSIGSWGKASRLMGELEKKGVDVVIHHRLGPGFLESTLSLVKELFGKKNEGEQRGVRNHDHRKLTIVDGRVAFLGGMNIGDKYQFEWHDLQCRVEGPVVDELTDSFLDRWRAAGQPAPRDPSRLRSVERVGERSGGTSLGVLAQVPGLGTPIRDAYLREIAAARTKILIENPYFIADDVVTLLQKKAREGVPTTVIVPAPEHQDSWQVAGALQFMESEIVRSGVNLRKYRGRMTHGKIAAIDDRWTTIGSCNLDDLSLTKLAELNVEAQDPALARHFEERVFLPDLPMSDPVVIQQLSWWQKIKFGTLHFLRSFF